jgi:hypothetical protein
MTDFRALCEELFDALDQCQRPYGDKPESSLVWKARAALAEQPVGPTDEKLLFAFYEASLSEGGDTDEVTLRGLRAVLARWGQS